jgi:transcriptional regulator with XRE-family HTH domain
MTKAYQAERASQAEMAERVGVDRSFLADVERATAAPSENSRQNKSPVLASGTSFQVKSQERRAES